MLSRSFLLPFLLVLVVAGLGLGIYELFALRLEGGDVYPIYSTLRADPLGAKAFSEALAELPGFHVSRNYLGLPKLKPREPITLVYIGVPTTARWEPGELQAFEEIVRDGGRAIFTFLPHPFLTNAKSASSTPAATPKAKTKAKAKPSGTPKAQADQKKKKGSDKDDDEEDTTPERTLPFTEVTEKWGLKFETAKEEKVHPFDGPAECERGETGLEATLPWHSALFFTGLKPEWRTLYRAAGEPVVIERALGKGTIVLVSDSFLLSNEALYTPAARAPQFLSWLVGPHHEIVFDEEHHGLRETPGVASLMLKYQLHWLLAALGLLAALFLWQHGIPFLPPASGTAPEVTTVAGRGAAEGLRTLLRRGVPASKLIDTCLTEWRHAADPREKERVDDALTALAERPAKERTPLATYRAIVTALTHHRTRKS